VNKYYSRRRAIRSKLLAMGHQPATLDQHSIEDYKPRDDKAVVKHATDIATSTPPTAPPLPSSSAHTSGSGTQSRSLREGSRTSPWQPLRRPGPKAIVAPVFSCPEPVIKGNRDIGVDRRGQLQPQIATCQRRIAKLIDHLDGWLESGFPGTRLDVIKALEQTVSHAPLCEIDR